MRHDSSLQANQGDNFSVHCYYQVCSSFLILHIHHAKQLHTFSFLVSKNGLIVSTRRQTKLNGCARLVCSEQIPSFSKTAMN